MSNVDLSKAPPWATHLVETEAGSFWFVNWKTKQWTVVSTYCELTRPFSSSSEKSLRNHKITDLSPIVENE